MFQQLCVHCAARLPCSTGLDVGNPQVSRAVGALICAAVCSPAGSCVLDRSIRRTHKHSLLLSVCHAGPGSAWLMACAGKEASCYVCNH